MIAASRVAIAAALVAFLAGSTLGLAMGVGWLTPLWRPAHAHLQSLGFVTLMIQGVAYHALPRFRGVPFRRPGLALIQVIATVVAVTGMTLGWDSGWDRPGSRPGAGWRGWPTSGSWRSGSRSCSGPIGRSGPRAEPREPGA